MTAIMGAIFLYSPLHVGNSPRHNAMSIHLKCVFSSWFVLTGKNSGEPPPCGGLGGQAGANTPTKWVLRQKPNKKNAFLHAPSRPSPSPPPLAACSARF